MKTILINDQQKEYQGHQVKSVKYNLSSKTAEVHCSVITPEGAWDYVISGFPFDDEGIDTSNDASYLRDVNNWADKEIQGHLKTIAHE